MPKILKRTHCERKPEKEENTYFMKMWTWSLSHKWKSIQKLDAVLEQAGFSSPQISVQFSVRLFQTGNTRTSI